MLPAVYSYQSYYTSEIIGAVIMPGLFWILTVLTLVYVALYE